RLGFHDFSSHLLRLCSHLLLNRHGGGATHLGFRLCNALVGLGLLGLQFRADVIADIHIGDIDRENFERRVAIETFGQHCLRNAVGILRPFFIGMGETNPPQIPSPTRAMIVSSVAPPTNRSRCERTVTRAFTFTPMPSCATPSIVPRPIAGLGASITFGLILVRTASNTVLPVPLGARAMAQERLKSSVIPALSAAIRARTKWPTSPPAR